MILLPAVWYAASFINIIPLKAPGAMVIPYTVWVKENYYFFLVYFYICAYLLKVAQFYHCYLTVFCFDTCKVTIQLVPPIADALCKHLLVFTTLNHEHLLNFGKHLKRTQPIYSFMRPYYSLAFFSIFFFFFSNSILNLIDSGIFPVNTRNILVQFP